MGKGDIVKMKRRKPVSAQPISVLPVLLARISIISAKSVWLSYHSRHDTDDPALARVPSVLALLTQLPK